MTWRKASSQAVEQHFSYDDEHRISEVRFDGHKEFSRAEYRYDVPGRRMQKILHRHGKEAGTVTFIRSGLRMTGESSSFQPARNTQYIYGENSWEPLARVDSIGEQSDIFWYHTELNGLPERMTDEHGEVVWRGRFSTWGETERESATGFQAVQQNLRFQGQYLDRESGLHYNLFRYYDPVGGRFTQVDPIGLAGGINTYGYVGDPMVWVDPLGLVKCSAGKPPSAYSTAYEMKLSKTSYPGVSRGRHFQEANESLLKAMESDKDFAQNMKGLGINLERTPTGLAQDNLRRAGHGTMNLKTG